MEDVALGDDSDHAFAVLRVAIADDQRPDIVIDEP